MSAAIVFSLVASGFSTGVLFTMALDGIVSSHGSAATGSDGARGKLVLEFKVLTLKARIVCLQIRNRLLQRQNRRLRRLGAGLPAGLEECNSRGDTGDQSVDGGHDFTEVHAANSPGPAIKIKTEGGEP